MTTMEVGTTDILDIPPEYYGDFAEDYNHKAIREQYHEVVQSRLPEGVYLTRSGIIIVELEAKDKLQNIDWDQLAEETSGELEEIIQRNDLTAERGPASRHER
ncbi:hypothetical protein ABT332_06605 [Saccharomonospora azurea]|uniref:hypothetical protein n=1 Tax=Saccharomonospora azurea TaxID=40988 RepID=UPI00332EBAB0